MAKIIEGLLYSESHEFVKVEGNTAYIGITDFAQSQLGNVVYVELPEEGDEVEAEETFGAVESVKAASDEPELVNKDAFENWIMKVELSDTEQLKGLMSAADYEKFVAQ